MGSKDFGYTGAWQRFRVPKDVKIVTVTVEGGGSNSTPGGRVSGRIAVNHRQTLFLLVGRRGREHSGSEGGAETFGGGGAGGDGTGKNGGWSGAGASAIRLNSTTGRILAVAGGAGGASGDSGEGGRGGATVGEAGHPGTAGDGATSPATGGTAIQGGNGGTSILGGAYSGDNALNTALSRGGKGGKALLGGSYGGGGGGGGFRPGGGGQAGATDLAPGGGGGGGSNYKGGLSNWSDSQGRGGVGNGAISLSWVNPPPANQPPSPPTDVKVAGRGASDGLATRARKRVGITAKVDDPSANQKVRLVARYSARSDFRSGVKTETSDLVKQGKRARVTLTGLSQNTRYYVRLYTRDSHGKTSTNYTSTNFWTNRSPLEPTLLLPGTGATVLQLASVVFTWTHRDPDETPQRAFRLRWRLASTPLVGAGEWTTREFRTSFNQFVADPGTFKANLIYEWQVRTQDSARAWGPWAPAFAFFVSGQALAPLPLAPVRDEALDVTEEQTFGWTFRDPEAGDLQATADLRWRVIGTSDWFTRTGDPILPGGDQFWVLPPNTFQAGQHYEWQVRTTDTISDATSDWSEPSTFWTVGALGGAITSPVTLALTVPRAALGQGHNRVFIFDRGGEVMRGELTPLTSVNWQRKRDDIASNIFVTNGFGGQKDFYRSIHTWRHEAVVYRDGERVAEGPITRITDHGDRLEIEAKDVIGYPYRRILRQGYNDSYRLVNGVRQSSFSIVERATKIIVNALAPDDPNVLAYLTTFNFPDDAGQSRVVPPYTKTAWEEFDDMAANAGLDYTAAGRRILLWDTHRPIGRLPEMRSSDFSDPPVITEYGMQFANHYGVTNGTGLFGAASRAIGPEGLVELLSSAYGETEAAAEEALTPEAREALVRTLNSQAERNIAGRYPVPVVVRVPDGSSLSPDANIAINDLIPGVWIPLRAEGGCLEAAQWQKLDLLNVTEDASGEKVAVTMSPAPNGGADPDAEGGTEEDVL